MMIDGPRMVPLFIEPASLRVLFIGGGMVALRKAEHLRDCLITVISKEINDELRNLTSNTIDRGFSSDDLDLINQHDIVIAATDDRVMNDFIVRESRARRVLVNSVHGGGDFMIPSTLRRDDFTICASTEGAAPVLPPFLIRTIDGMLDSNYDKMASLIKRVRSELRNRVTDQKARASLLEAILYDESIWAIVVEDPERAYQAAMELVR